EIKIKQHAANTITPNNKIKYFPQGNIYIGRRGMRFFKSLPGAVFAKDAKKETAFVRHIQTHQPALKPAHEESATNANRAVNVIDFKKANKLVAAEKKAAELEEVAELFRKIDEIIAQAWESAPPEILLKLELEYEMAAIEQAI
ncbi:MAG: hypothetical protein ABII75_02560, partial [Candidatus Omnitrophota bacterium]